MFKSLNIQTNKEIVIIDPKWQQDLDSLLAMDRADILVCQGCREPVRVRAGQERRHHFAHKHRLRCSYSDESADLLDARAVLYEWLSGKFGENVSIEKKVEENYLFRPVDCWVERDNKIFAYWIIDTSLTPEKRDKLRIGFNRLNVKANYVFTTKMLHQVADDNSRINLTTTERDLMQRSKYDEVHDFGSNTGKSLHYLDPQQRQIITFRALNLVHLPQVYMGAEIRSELIATKVSPANGEFVHSGEYEQLKEFREEKEALEKRRREIQEQQRKIIMSPPQIFPNQSPFITPASVKTIKTEHESPIIDPQFKEGVCIFCDEITTDWWYHEGKSGLCKCKKCLNQGRV
jgi:hypothetical protein